MIGSMADVHLIDNGSRLINILYYSICSVTDDKCLSDVWRRLKNVQYIETHCNVVCVLSGTCPFADIKNV